MPGPCPGPHGPADGERLAVPVGPRSTCCLRSRVKKLDAEFPAAGLWGIEEYLRADHPLLSYREKVIISRRYGVREGADMLTLAEVGQELGLSKERVRQMQASALGKLRSALLGEPIPTA